MGLANLTVLEAPDGAVLVDLVLANDPDLVLSDWSMPTMSGLEALKAIRAGGSQIRFGFITSEGTAAMREQATQAGGSFLLVKPFNADAMERALSTYAAGLAGRAGARAGEIADDPALFGRLTTRPSSTSSPRALTFTDTTVS